MQEKNYLKNNIICIYIILLFLLNARKRIFNKKKSKMEK